VAAQNTDIRPAALTSLWIYLLLGAQVGEQLLHYDDRHWRRMRTAGASLRTRAAALVMAGMAAAALTLLPAGTPLAAAEAAAGAVAAPSPVPSDSAGAPAPVITSFPRDVVKTGSADFAGTKTPGTDVRILVDTDDVPYCETPSDQRGASTWTCTATELPSGQSVSVRALATGTTSASAPVAIRVLNAPILRGTAAGVITGTSVPGADVRASSSTGSKCTAIPWSDTSWSCVLDPVPPSGPVTVSATQQTPWSDGPSATASVTIVVDSTSPVAPTVTSPAPGARVPLRGTTYTGTGEEGATVDLYRSVYPVCSTVALGVGVGDGECPEPTNTVTVTAGLALPAASRCSTLISFSPATRWPPEQDQTPPRTTVEQTG
jgi:hypothetical protein